MNCKQGDLAIVVRSWAGNEGKIVRCLRLATEREISCVSFDKTSGPVWVTDSVLFYAYRDGPKAGSGPLCLDSYLRPIRDPGDDATDETLTWLPVPRKEIA